MCFLIDLLINLFFIRIMVKENNKSRKARAKEVGTIYVTKIGKLEIWKENKLLKEEYIDKEVKYTQEETVAPWEENTLVKENGEKEEFKIIKWTHKQTRLNCGISFRKKVDRDKLFKIIEMFKEQEGAEGDMGFGLFD